MKVNHKTLKTIRELAGWSQARLSKEMRVTSNYVSIVETGKKRPGSAYLEKFCKVMKIPARFLYWDDINIDGPISKEEKAKLAQINELQWNLIRLWISSKLKE